jgi:hypothetical protein
VIDELLRFLEELGLSAWPYSPQAPVDLLHELVCRPWFDGQQPRMA